MQEFILFLFCKSNAAGLLPQDVRSFSCPFSFAVPSFVFRAPHPSFLRAKTSHSVLSCTNRVLFFSARSLFFAARILFLYFLWESVGKCISWFEVSFLVFVYININRCCVVFGVKIAYFYKKGCVLFGGCVKRLYFCIRNRGVDPWL